MHPTGLGSAVSDEKLAVGFREEHSADYTGVAAAAGVA